MSQDLLQLLTLRSSFAAPLAIGLTSACGFAVANSLQHLVAGTVPGDVRRASAVLRHLIRRRQWLVATFISFLAMGCHAWALRLGSIALVQPLMLAGVVLAVPLRAGMERRRPPWAAVRAVGITVFGLAAFLTFSDLHRGTSPPRVTVAACLVLLGGSAAVALSRCGARLTSQTRAALLGVTAGVMFGLTAGLLKLLGGALFHTGTSATTLMVLVGSLLLVGLVGTAVNQRAYQIAPIAFSMPLVNVVDIMVALLFGAMVFGELPGHSLQALVLQGAALGCVTWGLRGIAHLDREDRRLGQPATIGATS